MDANPDDFSAVPILETLRFFRTRSRTSTQKCNDASQRPGLNFLALKGTEPQSHSMQISQVRVQKRYYAIFEVRRAGSEARTPEAMRLQTAPSIGSVSAMATMTAPDLRSNDPKKSLQHPGYPHMGMRSDAVPEEVRKGQCDVSGDASAALPCFCATMTGNRGRS